MAINRDAFELLCWSKKQGANSWNRVLTLGRQSVILQPWDVNAWRNTSGGKLKFDSFLNRYDDASAGEELLKNLGASSVSSMDVSAYEGASIVHNLNQPIPEDLKLSFDVVYDGGTLEHVFDYPVALCNALSMVKEGGWFLSITPSNMWCGHGFYQIGPDVFRAIINESNGFELSLMAFAVSSYQKEYWIYDSKKLKSDGRLGISSNKPTCLLIAARRISSVLIPKLTVEQPDYVSRWDASALGGSKLERPVKLGVLRLLLGRVSSFLPWSLRGRIRHWLSWKKIYASHSTGLRRSNSLQ